jgi:L-arabinose isomerase
MAKVGLLGLYLELYDKRSPVMRPVVESFYETIALELENRGLDVLRYPVCRLKNEFSEAVEYFETNGAEGLVTLHLAYSPSLESSEVLGKTNLPIYILDTTPDFNFNVSETYNAISYNHGIHGVQDMCNLLLRNKKYFIVEAGHWKESDVIDRLCSRITGGNEGLYGIRVGIIGSPFKGMGDFAVDFETLKERMGIETFACDYYELKIHIGNVTKKEIMDEINQNIIEFTVDIKDTKLYESNIRTCLGVRKWIKNNSLDAFTVNFMDVDSKNGLSSVPFYEASKQMAAGNGYAGEGDVMTSALVSALQKQGCETSFTEIFCPDWAEDALFLSHMGEMNINLCNGKPVLHEKEYIFSDVEVNPIVFSGEFKSGEAVLVNLSPSANGEFTLIAAPISMFSCNKVKNGVRGWFRPNMPISDFLSEYSRHGGTHHSALVYGNCIDKIKNLAQTMKFKLIKI